MRLRNIRGAEEAIAASEYVVHNIEDMPNKWKELFHNKQPIHIEVGMGKGQFIYNMAKQNPDTNYIGIEKYSSVLLRALQKMEVEPISNLKFMCMDAEDINKVFAKDEVDKIYLNFSDPWPKDRHSKRRLPSREFLSRFGKILTEEGRLEFKTDNKALFDFAVEELKPANWLADVITYDLHADSVLNLGNVMTEYEEKFSAIGNPICKYVIHKLNDQGRKAKMIFTVENFEEEVLKSDLPVFVDYYADWCGPCKMMAPLVEKMEEKFQGKIKIGKCNIDENMEIAQTYKVASIPTFILFKEGIAVGTYVGAMSAKELEEILEQALL